ncbi:MULTISPECIES: hypothetical protein [unclassified Fredinandcohnia]
MQRSPRIYSKIVKYSIILRALGVIDSDVFNQITGNVYHDKPGNSRKMI